LKGRFLREFPGCGQITHHIEILIVFQEAVEHQSRYLSGRRISLLDWIQRGGFPECADRHLVLLRHGQKRGIQEGHRQQQDERGRNSIEKEADGAHESKGIGREL